MNDELQATNDELRDRTTEITSLNVFLESILGSLGAAVVVGNREMVVQIWNEQAAELWGLREDETIGNHLLNLDSGLPTEKLKPLLRDVIFEGNNGGELALEAVNRRGRSVRLQVSVRPLRATSDEPNGALLLMEQVDA
jgi:two-component system CheB/CheR fusion protein